MKQDTSSSIIVAGSGPAGLIAALALARAGFSVTLVGPDIVASDHRTTALMAPALDYLGSLGLADHINRNGAPLAVMRIVDATKRLVRSPVVTFRAAEIGEPYFGLNLTNRDLNAALQSAVEDEPAIDWRKALVKEWDLTSASARAILSDGTAVEASLAVAADGRLSPARKAAGIPVSGQVLSQSALVLTFTHTRPHGDISTEFHTETGPFTQVPLKGERSSLVWVLRPKQATDLSKMENAALSRLVEDRMQSMLGRIEIEPNRQVYPLTASTPLKFALNRVALVGEAAHIFPPIGAQGLNLGVRDVSDLAQVAMDHKHDPGSHSALSAYDARRRPDILARSAAVNLLNRSLLSDMLPAQLARSAGLSALGALPPLRALFMREGLHPGSGLSALAAGLREQIRR